MNPFLPRTCAAIAATVALSAAATAIPQAAHAYLIKRSTGLPVSSSVNPSLAPPTRISFDRSDALVTNEELVTSTDPNGSANIKLIGDGYAAYAQNQLQIGQDNTQPRRGEVEFQFGDPRGMGYLGFFLQQTPTNPANGLITFFNNGAQVASFNMSELLTSNVLGSTVVGTGNYFSFFVTNNNEIFDQVRFADLSQGSSQSNNGGLLIIDDLTYQAIPTPALLPGLVGLGLGLARKKKAQAEAEA